MKTKVTVIILIVLASTFFIYQKYFSSNTVETTQLEITNGTYSGCGNVRLIYSNENQGISIFVDGTAISLTETPTTLDISDNQHFFIKYFEGDNLSRSQPTSFCNDVLEYGLPEPKAFIATEGKITISTNQTSTTLEECEPFEVNATIEGLVLENINETLTVGRLEFKNTQVGWCPG